MPDIELIPGDYALARIWRSELRHFATALVLLMMVAGAARLWLDWRIDSERPKLAALRQAQTVANARSTGLAELRKEKEAAEARLQALQSLRDRAAWPIVFRAIDAAHHPTIWFDELDYSREARVMATAGAAPPAPVATPAAAAAPSALLHRFEIAGHALSHAAVTDFMRGLGTQPGITQVRLTDSGMRRYSMVEVVDFRLTGFIDTHAGAAR